MSGRTCSANIGTMNLPARCNNTIYASPGPGRKPITCDSCKAAKRDKTTSYDQIKLIERELDRLGINGFPIPENRTQSIQLIKRLKASHSAEQFHQTGSEPTASEPTASEPTASEPTKDPYAAPYDDQWIREALDRMSDRIDTVSDTVANLADVVAKLNASRPKVTSVTIGTMPTVKITKRTHQMFPKVLAAMVGGTFPMLIGPAGTGKSHLIGQCAEAMGLDFYPFPGNPDMGMHDLRGFKAPGTGEYMPPTLQEPWANGGVWLLDEADNVDPSVLAGLNQALSNRIMSFADGSVVPMHPRCYIGLTGNTWGYGADNQYIGRTQLDAATLDRLVRINIDYDDAIETEIAFSLNSEVADTVLAIVRQIRTNQRRHGIEIVVSPRTTADVCKLTATGEWEIREAMETKCLAGVDADTYRLLTDDGAVFAPLN